MSMHTKCLAPGQAFFGLCLVALVQVVVTQIKLFQSLEMAHGRWHARKHVVGGINALDAPQSAHA